VKGRQQHIAAQKLRMAEAQQSRIDRELRRDEEHQEKIRHKEWLAQECGLAEHPKLDLLYSIAWEHGHSSGFDEVANYFRDFARLLQ
jgi:hypothetical protein